MVNFPVQTHHFLPSQSPFWRKKDKFCGFSYPKHVCVWGFRLTAAMAIVIATAMAVAMAIVMAIAMAITKLGNTEPDCV